MFKGRLLLIVVAALLISANAQGAWSVSTLQGNGADTYLSNDSQGTPAGMVGGPNIPHGTANTFEVRDYANTRQRIAYIRFDLTGIAPAEGHTWADVLKDATLSLEVTTDAKSRRSRWVGVYGLNNTTAAANWPEATTTYGGGVYDGYGTEGEAMTAAPGMVWVSATAPSPGFYAINDSLLRMGEFWLVENPGASGTWLIETSSPTEQLKGGGAGESAPAYGSLNMDSFLASLITETGTNRYITLALIYEASETSNDWWIASKETAKADPLRMAPTLNLPNAIPEPATIALLGLGGLSLLRIRRKR